MQRVGIVGGLGPESTIDYYRRIIELWQQEDPGGSPAIMIDSLDVRTALDLVARDGDEFTQYLLESLLRLARSGADFLTMTANTPHIVFDELARQCPIPMLSIVEVCAGEAKRLGLGRLLLLGTRFTMEATFFADVFARHGIAVVVPDEEDRTWVHDRYVGQLLKGDFREDTRGEFVALITRMRDADGVDGVILGGTELALLLPSPVIADLPVLDTTALHVAAIVRRLREES